MVVASPRPRPSLCLSLTLIVRPKLGLTLIVKPKLGLHTSAAIAQAHTHNDWT